MDLEGCLVPEIWIRLAAQTGIDELKVTTRDIKDYDELMSYRLGILEKHGIGMTQLRTAIESIGPMEGALEYTRWVRERFPFIILSDTFYEFADPLMKQLERPTLLCHTLEVDARDRLVGYHLRTVDGKAGAVRGLQDNGFRVISIGDSYNDVTMLKQADQGILFHAPDNVIQEFPQFPACTNYEELKAEISKAAQAAQS
jgi:phosphoserine/homoserine phosphotransferase